MGFAGRQDDGRGSGAEGDRVPRWKNKMVVVPLCGLGLLLVEMVVLGVGELLVVASVIVVIALAGGLWFTRS